MKSSLYNLVLTIFITLLILLILIDLTLGDVYIPLSKLTSSEPMIRFIMYELRLPTTLSAALVGFALGSSGSALQTLFRNPLAEPYLLGISSGAALCVAVVFYYPLSTLALIPLHLAGLLGAILVSFVMLVAASFSTSISFIILLGAMLSALLSSILSLILILAPNPYALSDILYWTIGSLQFSSHSTLLVSTILVTIGSSILLSIRFKLDKLFMPLPSLPSLGVNLKYLQILVILAVSLSVGGAVSSAGVFAFVGLMSPHFVRALNLHFPSQLILPAGLSGACLVITAHILSKTFLPMYSIPPGVFTSLLGAPFFIFLLIKLKNNYPL